MDDLKITKAKKEDFPYIQEKLGKYLLDAANVYWRQFFVAKLQGKTLAFGRIIDHQDSFEIASLGVDYYHRKHGLGKQMLSFLIAEAQRLDRQRPIYGVTHVTPFVASCGFVPVKDNYPDYLECKRKHCHLEESRISIVKWVGGSA